jgi:hypothetical protein
VSLVKQLLGKQAESDETIIETAAGFLLMGGGLCHIIESDEAARDQKLRYLHSFPSCSKGFPIIRKLL